MWNPLKSHKRLWWCLWFRKPEGITAKRQTFCAMNGNSFLTPIKHLFKNFISCCTVLFLVGAILSWCPQTWPCLLCQHHFSFEHLYILYYNNTIIIFSGTNWATYQWVREHVSDVRGHTLGTLGTQSGPKLLV